MATFYPYRTRRKYSESEGINDEHTWTVKCEAIGKCRSDVSPYLIANEWIAASLAQFLRLPVPPFSLVRKKSRKTVMFASYSFEGDIAPADADPEALYRNYPDVCTGVVLFDVLVANCDRHGGNIKVDKPSDPTAVHIFDHERALFYVYPKEGIKRLHSRANRLGVTDGDRSKDEFHCLVGLVDSVATIKTWVERIGDIPDWFIEATCADVWKVAITDAERNAVVEFLKVRRDNIGGLILKHKDRFPRVTTWPLFL